MKNPTEIRFFLRLVDGLEGWETSGSLLSLEDSLVL